MIDITLTYYKTEVVSGRNYYYLKAVFLPTDLAGDMLLLLLRRLGEDVSDFFNVATGAPVVIPAGYRVYNFGGGYWEAPADIYRTYVYDRPWALSVVASGLSASVPYVVYCDVAPTDTTPVESLPDDGAREAVEACRSAESTTYVPDGYVLTDVYAASRLNEYPFWTRTQPVNWWMYSGCNYELTEPALYAHHTTLMTYYQWAYGEISGGWQEGAVSLMHSGHALKITSNLTHYAGYPISTVYEGDLSYTVSQVLVLAERAYVVDPALVDMPVIIAPYRRRAYGYSAVVTGSNRLGSGVGSIGRLSRAVSSMGRALRDQDGNAILDNEGEEVLQ